MNANPDTLGRGPHPNSGSFASNRGWRSLAEKCIAWAGRGAVHLGKFNVNVRRLIVGFYFVLFLGVGLTSGVFFLQARAEYDQLKQQEAASRRRLEDATVKLREQEKIIERLRNDPVFVEQVIRRQLNYAKPDEFIFRFED
jgi:cell division protein DivIC